MEQVSGLLSAGSESSSRADRHRALSHSVIGRGIQEVHLAFHVPEAPTKAQMLSHSLTRGPCREHFRGRGPRQICMLRERGCLS